MYLHIIPFVFFLPSLCPLEVTSSSWRVQSTDRHSQRCLLDRPLHPCAVHLQAGGCPSQGLCIITLHLLHYTSSHICLTHLANPILEMQRFVTYFEYPCNRCISSHTLVHTFTWARFFLGADFFCLPARWPLPTRWGWHFLYMGGMLSMSHTCGMNTYFNL